MNESWKRWEGQAIDRKYRLESLIGGTDHSVVFQAEYRSPEPRKATVKLVAADIPNAQQILACWNQAAQLSHPNLQKILQSGTCKMEDRELLYVAMEYADENLAEVIPQRALTIEEAREALNAIVDVLVYLHGKELTHGHICPANILAIGEFLKVSSDSIEPLGEKREMTREPSEYDAPEIPAAPYTQAADVWSLGVTLVEILTQQRATLPFNESVDPVIPPGVREPFLEIARHALRRKPGARWTTAQIAERLNPSTMVARAAAAGAFTPATTAIPPSTPAATGAAKLATPSASLKQTVSVTPAAVPPPRLEPLSVPLSKEPPVPLGKQTRPTAPPVHVTVPGPKHSRRETLVLPNYALPLFIVVLFLVGAIALPKILRSRMEPKASLAVASTPEKHGPPAEAATPPATRAEEPARVASAPKSEARNSPTPPVKASATPTPAPAVMRSTENAPEAKARNSSDAQGRGEVLDQSLPQVSAKALSTITGTVRVVVKAHVDEAGQVTSADLEDSGPSRYFADKAVQAAQRWVFDPPETNGRSVASDWLIRFEYRHDGVKAFPQQAHR